MKINNKKVIISTLALAMGAALAGSVSGSVAWYQYSTRVAATINGTSAGTSRNLQISKDAGANYAQYVSFDAKNFRPVSAVADGTGKAVDHFVEHPVYQYKTLPTVTDNEVTTDEVLTVAYAEYSLVFKCEDTVGGVKGQVAKDVYLSALRIVNNGSKDVTPAVRIAIDGTNDFLVSATAGDTNTEGYLDLNNNTNDDTMAIDCQDTAPAAAVAGSALANGADGADGVDYYERASSSEGAGYLNDGTYKYTFAGTGDAVHADEDNKYFTMTDVGSGDPKVTYTSGADKYTTVDASSVVVDKTDAYEFSGTDNKDLTTTKVSGASEAVTVKIWLEGWQALGGSTLWDTAYQAQNFEIQMQFACEAEK